MPAVTTAGCRCGRVEHELRGAPITSLVCYCDDCQEGSRQIEALPTARAVRGPDGGTAYVLYRKDRVTCTRGAELLERHKLRPRSATSRVVTRCCRTPIQLAFDDRKHWVSMYAASLAAPPPVAMRICTKFRSAAQALPADVPSYARFPVRLVPLLLGARLAMLVGR